MRHVFVETNWVFAYAAPAHHKRLDAVELLARARANEVRIHLPAPCLTEARPSIMRKCQPRNEADAVRQFLLRARAEQTVSPDRERATREVLDRFEQQVRGELRQLDDVLKSIRTEPGLELFPLKQGLCEGYRSIEHVLGETELCFCVTDADLQPWGKRGNAKQFLTKLYDKALVWVYGDFGMNTPERPDNWPDLNTKA